jgi:hypothetical protein
MNKLGIEENKEYVETCFYEIFKQLNYHLKSADMNNIIYGNEFSEFIFIHDMQQYGYMIFMNLHYRNVSTDNQFDLQDVLDYLFEIDAKKIIDHYHQKMITQEKAYSILIEKHMLEIIKNNDFTWEEGLKLKTQKDW